MLLKVGEDLRARVEKAIASAKKKKMKEADSGPCLEKLENDLLDEMNPFLGIEFLFSALNMSETGNDAEGVYQDFQ